ncbi:MAG: response regulator transcription factor [Propionibacteriaceae bacterium]|jgi:DNA-binding NarL/FixJ family response regulator|nr:response regulator transcription factor [Propionibacteriaceae bacterium]
MKLLIVDDNAIILSGLTQKVKLLDPNIQVTSARSGEQALLALQKETFDLVFLDINMPGMDGLSVLGRIKDTPVVMLTSVEDERVVQSAMAHGARGYLNYGSFSDAELKAALLLAPRGGTVMSRFATNAVDFKHTSPKVHRTKLIAEHGLSARETEILQLVSEGCGNDEIAAELQISPQTVKTHMYHIFNKLGVNSRGAAAALWLGVGKSDPKKAVGA